MFQSTFTCFVCDWGLNWEKCEKKLKKCENKKKIVKLKTPFKNYIFTDFIDKFIIYLITIKSTIIGVYTISYSLKLYYFFPNIWVYVSTLKSLSNVINHVYILHFGDCNYWNYNFDSKESFLQYSFQNHNLFKNHHLTLLHSHY